MLTPALLRRKSIFSLPRREVTALPRAAMEGGELRSHSRMWRRAEEKALRPARVEGEVERDVAIMVFDSSLES